jgi:hypothetical protein
VSLGWVHTESVHAAPCQAERQEGCVRLPLAPAPDLTPKRLRQKLSGASAITHVDSLACP